VDGRWDCEVLAVTDGAVVGHVLVMDRQDIYLTPTERDYFGYMVRWLQDGVKIPCKRPEWRDL
jgi:hypothetical protein